MTPLHTHTFTQQNAATQWKLFKRQFWNIWDMTKAETTESTYFFDNIRNFYVK